MESWKLNFSPKLITLLEQGGGWIEVRLVGAIEMFIANIYVLMCTGYIQDMYRIYTGYVQDIQDIYGIYTGYI